MRRFLVGLLATIGALALLAAGGIALAVWMLLPPGPPELPERMVLDLDLRDDLPEVAPSDPLTALGLRRELTLPDAILALDRAADDPRVRGVLVRLDGDSPGLAEGQELREAVGRLREAGKFALAFADSFGEFGPGTRGYYLASAFDEIHLQPRGAVGLTGLMIETPLLRELLEEVGIEPALGKRGRYKTVADMFTTSELTPAHREMLTSLADSLIGQLASGIAEGRRLEPEAVAGLIDGGPYPAGEALEAGLVDRLSYWDQVVAEAVERTGPDGSRVLLEQYLDASTPVPEEAPVVAVVHGVGQIQRGDSEYGPTRGWILGADTVAGALADAIADPEVAAILFRVESGGGSAVASETIGRQVRRAVEAGKPVIVSMGELAASGGYWIAMDASRIVARPATLTGSIGVVAGKPVLSGLWSKLGVNWGQVQRGENASMWSVNQDYSEQGRARLESFLDRVYEDFVQAVASARGVPESEVREVAQGRVWTGAQAADLGLIDGLGGFAEALTLVKEAAGARPDEPVELRPYPRPRAPWQELIELIGGPLGGLALLRGPPLALPQPGVLEAPALSVR